MTAYIGTPTSRIDGRARSPARICGEFTCRPRLRSVVSTIAKGRIARIDASEAMRVDGVIAVLTHENRPPMADEDKAYKDDAAPERARRSVRSTTTRSCSTDSRSRWCWPKTGRPRASPPARARRVRSGSPRHRLAAQRGEAFALESPTKPRGDAAKAFAAAAVRHEAEYFIPIEHHNPMELFASTVIVGRRRQADCLR